MGHEYKENLVTKFVNSKELYSIFLQIYNFILGDKIMRRIRKKRRTEGEEALYEKHDAMFTKSES